jgi:hypothetical protein
MKKRKESGDHGSRAPGFDSILRWGRCVNGGVESVLYFIPLPLSFRKIPYPFALILRLEFHPLSLCLYPFRGMGMWFLRG